ncbi:MAG: thermonuclease family protein [Proteobacteria bacterium]|nr:hypothetical protein [Desulfobacula sp.]MBU4132571.1 thermonuclease family protein [Pseudomonadota bacterium]
MLTIEKKTLVVLFLLFSLVLPCFADPYKVMRVVDGDTLDIDYQGKRERIRLLNVDTPESVHPDKTRNTLLGKQASDYTRKRLAGKSVSLEFEGKKRGKYGRLLAYVILDRKNFNLELVQNGWSPYYTKYGQSQTLHGNFIDAQAHAKAQQLNIWADPPPRSIAAKPSATAPEQMTATRRFHGNTQSHKFHGPGCRYFHCSTCTRIFSSRNAAKDAGFFPCQVCLPGR